jgi:hypothetical protein
MSDVNSALQPAEGSAFGRMFNVLAAPSEVFEEIKGREVQHSNWVVPGVVATVIGIVAVLILFSQESFLYEIRKMQSKAMEDAVQKGKMPREAKEAFEKNPPAWLPMVMKVSGSVMAVMFAFGVPFFWGFFVWLFGTKVFKADFEYMKAVEAVGLTSIIYVVAGIIGVLASLSLNKMISISPAYFLAEADMTSKAHLGLMALNPFYFWFLGVVAVSMSVLGNGSWAKAAGLLLVVWLLHRAALIAINLGQFVM